MIIFIVKKNKLNDNFIVYFTHVCFLQILFQFKCSYFFFGRNLNAPTSENHILFLIFSYTWKGKIYFRSPP